MQRIFESLGSSKKGMTIVEDGTYMEKEHRFSQGLCDQESRISLFMLLSLTT
jgi:hypothetical protein